VVVGHGLGALAVVTALAGLIPAGVAGAYLVAPVDIASLSNGRSNVFDQVPLAPLPVPSVVVASTNDPYCPIGSARRFAAAWGSEITETGDCGHLDDSSGHGPWPEGLLRFGVFLKALG
jgi:predicted alpha/beta hydrolase family esterase